MIKAKQNSTKTNINWEITTYENLKERISNIYPGGINTNFYKDSRDYVSIEKQNSFMNPDDVAKMICDNIFSDLNLNIADITIERN